MVLADRENMRETSVRGFSGEDGEDSGVELRGLTDEEVHETACTWTSCPLAAVATTFQGKQTAISALVCTLRSNIRPQQRSLEK